MSKKHVLLVGCLTVLLGLAAYSMINGHFGLNHVNGWPFYLAMPGFFSLVTAFTTKNLIARLLFSVFGLILLLLGGFFFLFSFGVMSWKEMETLWPLCIIIAGVSELIAHVIGGRKTKSLLFTSLGLITGGVIALSFTRINTNLTILDKVWPLHIVILGAGIIFTATHRARSK